MLSPPLQTVQLAMTDALQSPASDTGHTPTHVPTHMHTQAIILLGTLREQFLYSIEYAWEE